jgi:quercetin dioxygenase-like cupin family protein
MRKPKLRSLAGSLAALSMAGVAIAQTASSIGANRAETPPAAAPPGLPAGAQAAVVDGDPGKPGFFVVRLRAPDGYKIRPHWHSQDEHVTVLSGKLEMGFGDQMGNNATTGGAGAYFSMQGGHHHYAMTRGESVIQLDGHGPFDIFYVNPSDDPRRQRAQ